MSQVYRAVDEQSGSSVAVKLVHPGDPAMAQRMSQEARALRRLEHPGLVRLLDVGVVGDQTYLVMELIDVPTLASNLGHGRLSPKESAALGARLASALAYVHSRGVVHRDVKPSNIFMSNDGEAYIGDFGIARLVDASTVTVAGTTLGTAAYMAPEQLEDHLVGPPADIWSLGIVLLECLTGQRVYQGTPSEVVARRLARPVPLPGYLPIPWKLILSGMLDHRADQRLDGTQVAALLVTSVFGAPWLTPDVSVTEPASPTAPLDLTALAPSAATTAGLDAQDTRVAPFPPTAVRPNDRPRRWWILAMGAVIVAGLGIGLLLGLAGGSATPRPGALSATRSTGHVSPPQPPTTIAQPPVSTITTPPDGPTALAALVHDIASGQVAGTLDTASGQAISSAAERAVTNQAAGMSKPAAKELQQAAMVIATGFQRGTITQAGQTTLQGDLSVLAASLGLSAASNPPVTASPSPGPAPGNKHGNGDGNGQ